MHKVFRRGVGEDLRDKVRRCIADMVAEKRAGIPHKLASGILILGGVNRRTEVLRLACPPFLSIDVHVTTSLIRGADCSGNRSGGRAVAATMWHRCVIFDFALSGFATGLATWRLLASGNMSKARSRRAACATSLRKSPLPPLPGAPPRSH